MDYIKKGRELVKKMLNSVHVTCEIDSTERALIISNWLIRQRASKQLNVHLEREESVREAVSRQSLVKNCNSYGRALLRCHFFLSTQKAFPVQLYEMLLCEVEVSHLADLSLALPFN